MPRELASGALVFVFAIAVVACDRGGSSTSGSSRNVEAATKAAPSAKVAKIVFVGKQNACECTRARIDKTWNALQKVLGTPSSIPVERLDLETQAEQVEPYVLMERLMVPPGIYLLDDGNGVIRMLQGEVTEPQLREALAGSIGP
jgi:hypothetical protein